MEKYGLIKKILNQFCEVKDQTVHDLCNITEILNYQPNSIILKENQKALYELIVVEGVIRAFIYNPDGDEITINFYCDNMPVTPIFSRSLNFKSYVNLQALTEVKLMEIKAEPCGKMRLTHHDIEQFGNTMMQRDAFLRAEKEMVLLTKTAEQKLEYLRNRYPNLENRIPHYYISSFLGITPTSLSRIRAKRK